jgi:hypothetical protein
VLGSYREVGQQEGQIKCAVQERALDPAVWLLLEEVIFPALSREKES